MIKTINGEPYVNIGGIIIMTLDAILSPEIEKDGKQRATRALNELMKLAKDKGHHDIEKILCRGVIDEFTIAKAEEVGKEITANELITALNTAGFSIS